MSSDVVEHQVPIEECLNGKTRQEALENTELDEDAVSDFVEWTKDIERSRALRELARDRLDEDGVPEADTLLWVDEAEVYPLCRVCYSSNQDGAWTGSTQNPDFDELQWKMSQRLEEGCPCAFCKSDRIDELKEEIADEVDVEVVIIE